MVAQHNEMIATASSSFDTTSMARTVTAPAKMSRMKFKGRKITLEECKFIFERIWKATVECTDEELAIPKEEKNAAENMMMLDDLFHVIDLTGKLLNKASPDGEDTKPFDEFMKVAIQTTISDQAGQDP